MAIAFIFLLGIGNFALHKAVLESGHRLMGWLARDSGRRAGRMTLVIEFGVLFAAMLLSASGYAGLAWAYFIYTLINAVSAWLILSGKV